MHIIYLTAVIFFAVFTQTTAGFGLVLVSMPFLVEICGIHVAVPLTV